MRFAHYGEYEDILNIALISSYLFSGVEKIRDKKSLGICNRVLYLK